jgi:hypothetical protein
MRAVVARAFNAYAVKGLYRPDEVMFWPGTGQPLLDGNQHETIVSLKRGITLALEPVTAVSDQDFLLSWAKSNSKRLIYLSDDVEVVLEDPSQLANVWASGSEAFPEWTLRLIEKTARTTNPISWGYTVL